MSNPKNTEELLAKYGLTRLEWDAMGNLSPYPSYSLDGLALSAASHFIIRDRRNGLNEIITADLYREAVLGLMKKGWLKLVSESPESRMARAAARGIRLPPVYRLAEVGCLDFTTRGYRWYRRVEHAVCPYFVEPERLAWTEEDTETTFCIAGTKHICYDWLDEVHDPDSLGFLGLGRSTRRVGVGGPEKVGPWKLREAAAIHPYGWQVSIRIEKVDGCPLLLPEWKADGWITPAQSLTITGKIGGFRFRFSDRLVELSEGMHAPAPRFKARLTIYDGQYEEKEESISTILNGVETLACALVAYGGTHFKWQDTPYPTRTKPLTIPEAIGCLQEGFAAWKRGRAQS